MASDTKSPGTIVDDSSIGTNAWANPSNASSSNNIYASATFTTGTSNRATHYLKATNFGFALATGATINGIEVLIERSESTTSANVTDLIVKLVKGGSIVGNNKADLTTEWTTTDTVITYPASGGSTDLWGTTWTYSDINSSNFGVVLQCEGDGGAISSNTADVDHIQITVYYTPVVIKNLTGVMTPTGGLKKVIKRKVAGVMTPTGLLKRIIHLPIFIGSMTPTGALTTIVHTVVVQICAGAMFFTGALTNKLIIKKVVSGAMASTGALAFRITKTLTGEMIPTGTLAFKKIVTKTLTGALTFVGTLTRTITTLPFWRDVPPHGSSSWNNPSPPSGTTWTNVTPPTPTTWEDD